MKAVVKEFAVYFPEKILNNEELSSYFAGWNAEKIESKTGIRERRIAAEDESVSDMAVNAAKNLFATGACSAGDIDFILLCTQSPDYILPTTACIVQDRLGVQTTAGALDFNLGCSGFVYGLGLAKGLIDSRQARNVLLITADTYSKYIHPGDKSVRTLFGDAATATLICDSEEPGWTPSDFVYGTDGGGAKNLIVPTGGSKTPRVTSPEEVLDASGNTRTINNLFMDGAQIFNFTLRTIPQSVDAILAKSGNTKEDIDLFLFHQANSFMLNHLRLKLNIPIEKFPILMANCGNTVSSTLPVLMSDLKQRGELKSGATLMLLGFGVGYSWGGCMLKWR